MEKWKNKTVLVTGATGLVAHFFALLLIGANEKLGINTHIILHFRNLDKAKSIYGSALNSVEYICQDITEPINYENSIDFIFHAAAVTTSKVLITKPVESFFTQVLGTKNILDLAKNKKSRIVFASSMEIYGTPTSNNYSTENDLGLINPLIVRNGYPESKRVSEFLSSAYGSEYGVGMINARLAQTFGPGVSFDDTRVFAQFLRNAINNEDIVLLTDGTSRGNYCYLRDAIDGILFLFENGTPGESYNIVNENTNITIRDMASMVSKKFGNGKVVYKVPDTDMGFAQKVNLKLSGSKMKSLGWESTISLEEMFERTFLSMEEDLHE